MPKDLFIIRHAKTEQISAGQSDFERQLTQRGHADAQLIGEMFKELGIKPDKIYASPAKRTSQTAQILCQSLAISAETIIFEATIYEASLKTLFALVSRFDEGANCAFLIGHNPGLMLLGDYLSNQPIDFLPTTGTIYLHFEIDSWQEVSAGLGHQQWFKTPKMLKSA